MKKWGYRLGNLLGILGVIFVVVRLQHYASEINFSQYTWHVWLVLTFLIVLYGSANALLAISWWHLLNFFSVKTEKIWAIQTYGLSQVAKYVPGNIFQFASRQVLGMSAAVPAKILAKTIFWELGGLAFCGALFGVLLVPLFFSWIPSFAALVIFGMTLSFAYFILRYKVSRPLSTVFLNQIAFLIVSGAIFVIILCSVTTSSFTWEDIPLVAGAFVLAWLAGLITPGAPAGLGIRELVLITLLNTFFQEAELLMAVLLGRAVTVFGDLLYYLTCRFFMGPRANSLQIQENV